MNKTGDIDYDYWAFLHMLEDSFVPRLPGQQCPDMEPESVAKTTNGFEVEGCRVEGGSGLMSVAGNCLKTQAVMTTARSNVSVRIVGALMALHPAWESIMYRDGFDKEVQESSSTSMKLAQEMNLQQQGVGQKAVGPRNKFFDIPIAYIVCDSPGKTEVSDHVSDGWLLDQTKLMNEVFAGKGVCPPEFALFYKPQKADTEISFKVVGIERIQHEACYPGHKKELGGFGFADATGVNEVSGVIKIFITPVEGFGGWAQAGQRVLVLHPFAYGTNNHNLAHEMGHYFSLRHTFYKGYNKDGCEGYGDFVADTNPQAWERFYCYHHTSCNPPSHDNMYNIMGYTS